jgi:hypothetical protein
MIDINKIRAEIANSMAHPDCHKSPNQRFVHWAEGFDAARDKHLRILDKHIAEAERKPSGEWVKPNSFIWRLQRGDLRATVIEECKDAYTYLIGSPDYPDCFDPPVNPTLIAAQLAAEEAMKKMEER